MRISLLLLLPLITVTGAHAQKQPQVQEISVRSPDDIKIDGRLTEWPNPFLGSKYPEAFLSAYNASSRIFYTISNDDANLYLTVRGLGSAAAQKILNGGIVFTISSNLDKKERIKAVDNVAITFPLPQTDKTVQNIMSPIWGLNRYLPDTLNHRKQVDSLVSIADIRLDGVLKEIGVSNIKEIPDSVLSIYNSEKIKGKMGFIKRMPVIEIAVPLKYLKLKPGRTQAFSYNIKLNGMTLSPNDFELAKKDPEFNINDLYGITPSDFWGYYTLATKP